MRDELPERSLNQQERSSSIASMHNSFSFSPSQTSQFAPIFQTLINDPAHLLSSLDFLPLFLYQKIVREFP